MHFSVFDVYPFIQASSAVQEARGGQISIITSCLCSQRRQQSLCRANRARGEASLKCVCLWGVTVSGVSLLCGERVLRAHFNHLYTEGWWRDYNSLSLSHSVSYTLTHTIFFFSLFFLSGKQSVIFGVVCR